MTQRPVNRRALRTYLVLFGIVGLGTLYAGIRGAADAADRTDRSADAGAQAPRFFSARQAFGHGGDRAGIDPYAPPGLPVGVTIDRDTGFMTGLGERSPKDHTWIDWPPLGAQNYEDGRDDVPDWLLALEDKPVAMAGFLKAIYEFDQIRSFLLVGSHLACCFGTFPGVGGVVEVTIAKSEDALGRIPHPILVTGRLEIRADYDHFRGRRRVALLFRIVDAKVRRLVGD